MHKYSHGYKVHTIGRAYETTNQDYGWMALRLEESKSALEPMSRMSYSCYLFYDFFCLQMTLKNQKAADNTIRWIMSRFADCNALNSLYEGPVRLVLRRSK